MPLSNQSQTALKAHKEPALNGPIGNKLDEIAFGRGVDYNGCVKKYGEVRN
jgi:hypothetical protein